MGIIVENGHGTTRDQVLKEIMDLRLFPHEWEASNISRGLGAYNLELHIFVISGELEIEIEDFPISAYEGAYVHIPSKCVHKLKSYDNVHLYIGLKTKKISELRRVYATST
jgi:glyoxylate utilization-related uncharacterized protein